MDCYTFRHIDRNTGNVLETDLIETDEETWDASPESKDSRWSVCRESGQVRAIRLPLGFVRGFNPIGGRNVNPGNN